MRLHDPLAALDGGRDGLDYYRAIFDNASGYLADAGRLYLEIGAGQLPAVCKIAGESGWQVSETRKDLSGVDRVICMVSERVANLQEQ